MAALFNQWYVQYGEQAYGPFTHAQMTEFVVEGRVISSSLISADPDRGFFEAERYPTFLEWGASQSEGMAAEATHTATQNEVYQTAQPTAALQQLVSPQQADPSIAEPVYAQAQSPAYNLQQATAPQQSLATRVLLIMAEIRSGQDMRFLQTLQGNGLAQRVGDTVWLLQTVLSAEQLRDHIATFMGKQDRLFIVDSFNNETSWANIGADMGPRIQEMWKV